MEELPTGLESVPPAQDSTAADACPFEAPPDPAADHLRHQVTKTGAQRLFNNDDPYGIAFDMERQLRDEPTIALMLERTPERGNLLISRTLRRAFFASRGHFTDRHLLRYATDRCRNNAPFTDDTWPTEPDFYRSTTVRRYYGAADRFMRTIVGMGDLAAEGADIELSEPFKVVFHGVYKRYFENLEAHKKKYPAEDVPEVDPDPEVNWKLGRRGNGDNTAAVLLAHALAYFRQHPDASADDIWRSSLTNVTVLTRAARIRRKTFIRLGLKDIVPDFDAWEIHGNQAFETHSSLFAYDDAGTAIPLHKSLTDKNDSYCSANVDVEHTRPSDQEDIVAVSEWIKEQSDWPGVDDGQGGLLHENGIFNQASFQLMLGGCIGRTTFFPRLLDIIRERYPENHPARKFIGSTG